MKKFRFIAVILALILVVGMTTGLIVRKQTGGQTVMQHSSGPASATSGEEDPSAPVEQVAKIMLLVEQSDQYSLVVTEDGVPLDPIDNARYGVDPEPEAKPGGTVPKYGVDVDRYLVDPNSTQICVSSGSAKTGEVCFLCYVCYDEDMGVFSSGSSYSLHLNETISLSGDMVFAFVKFN